MKYLSVSDGLSTLEDYLDSAPEEQERNLVISLVARRKGQHELEGWAFEVDRMAADKGCLPAETRADFGTLAGFLHTLIAKPEVENLDPARNAVYSKSGDLQEFAASDNSVLTHFMFRLMTGLRDHHSFLEKSDTSTPHNSAFVCAEVIRAYVTGTPGPLQRTSARILNNASHTDKTHFFSRFNIAVSRTNTNIQDAKKADKKFLTGIHVTKNVQAAQSLDNLDMRYGGSNAGIAHFITHQLSIFSEDQVNAVSSGLCRKRYVWDDIREQLKLTPKKLCPQTKQFSTLHNFKGTIYQNILNAFFCFPDLESMLAAAKNKSLESIGDVKIGSYGVQRAVNPESNSVNTTTNNYEINNTHPDMVAAVNLAKKQEGVEERMKYAVRTWMNILGEDSITGHESDDEDAPVMANGFFYVCVDGQPAGAMLRIQAEKPQHYGMLKVSAGGFHRNLNLARDRGKILGDARLRKLVSGWRPSLKKVEWFMFPGDPGQHDAELWEYVYAHLFMQIAGYVFEHIELIRNDGAIDISVTDVQDFVLERCFRNPELTLAEYDVNTAIMSLMYQDAENAGNRKGDGEMYTDLNILTQMVWAVSNAPTYMKIGEEDVKNEFTMSDADKAIYKNLVITKKTVGGGSVWTDRHMEWQQKDTKIGNGSKTTSNTKRQESYLNR
jgi:hypothetical protein